MELICKELVQLTPDLATTLEKINTFEQQRNRRDDHIRTLMQKIRDDLFLTGSVATARLKYNGGQTVLVNGQHQCRAVVGANIPVDVVYEQYTVDSPEELSLLYRQFDGHAARSLRDISKPEAHALDIDWPQWVVSLVITGASLRESKRGASKDYKVTLLKKYRRAGEFIVNVLGHNKKKVNNMARGPVVAAMILTWERCHEDAYTFWTQVRDGEYLTRKMPAYRLRDYLSRHNVTSNGGRLNTEMIPATSHEVISKCITAWNAFRREQTTDLKYFADKPIPRAL